MYTAASPDPNPGGGEVNCFTLTSAILPLRVEPGGIYTLPLYIDVYERGQRLRFFPRPSAYPAGASQVSNR